MRISDWSSDVCSSDLKRGRPFDKLRACPGLDPGANGKEYGHRQPHWPRISFSLAWVVASISPIVLSVSFCTSVSWRLRSSSPNSPFFRSEEHTSELQSLMRISYAVFCLKKKTQTIPTYN